MKMKIRKIFRIIDNALRRRFKDKYKTFSFFRKKYDITLKKMCDIMDVEVPSFYRKVKNEKIDNVTLLTDEICDNTVLFVLYLNRDLNKIFDKAMKKGVKFIIVDRKHFESFDISNFDVPFIIVDDIIQKVGKFYSYIRNLYSAKIVGITGTVGKTTTNRLIETVTKRYFSCYSSPGNTNAFMAVAKHIFENLNDRCDVFIQECGAGGPNSIKTSVSMLKPDIFVFLNVTNHHMNTYKTYENLFEDKSSFRYHMNKNGVAIVNFDDEGIRKTKFNIKTISFGIKTKYDVDYRAINIKQNNDFLEFDVVYDKRCVHIKLNILGEYNVYNALACFVTCKVLGLSDKKIKSALEDFKTVGIRQNLSRIGDVHLLVDCYNVCKESIINGMETISNFKISGKKIAVLGAENKLGDNAYQVSYETGLEMKCDHLDEIIVLGPKEETTDNINKYGHGRALYEALKTRHKNVIYVTDLFDISKKLKFNDGDLIYFKSIIWTDMTTIIDRIFDTSFSDFDYYSTRAKVYENDIFTFKLFKNMDYLTISKYKGFEREVTIPNEFEKFPICRIGTNSFNKKRVSEVIIGENVKNIGKKAFFKTKLKEVVVPKSVRIIEESAFYGCKNLRKVEVLEGAIHIDSKAFSNCSSLREVILPSSIKYIKDDAFDNSKNICIKAIKGTYAYNFAKENNIKLKEINEK